MRCAIIGVGRMGLRHLRIAREAGFDIVGVADRQQAALARAQQEFALRDDVLFEDGEALLRARRPELAIVAITAPGHCGLTLAAAQSGAQAVLCEKPMAVSLAECERMIQTCRRTGTRLAINHQMRFMEQYTRPKSILESEALGGLSSVTVVAGNFGLSMNGTHYFEMFRYLAGEAPVSVTSWFSPETLANPRGAEFEDRAGAVRLTTASGRRFYLDASADQGHGVSVIYAGRHGRVLVDELAGTMQVVVREAEHRNLPTSRYGMPWREETLRIAPADAFEPTRAVLRALVDGAGFPDGETGRKAVEVLVAAYASHEGGGRTVDLRHEALPTDRVFPWA